MKLGKKVLVTDIDGTLVTSKKVVTDRVRSAIVKFQEMGGILILASGRPTCGMKHIVDDLELMKRGGYVMSYNGSMVTNAATNEVIFEKTMSSKVLSDAVKIAKEFGISLLTYDGDTIIAEDDSDKYFQLEMKINRLGLKLVDDMVKYVDFDIPRIMGTGEPEVLKKLEIALKEKIEGYSISRSEPFFVEISPPGITKGDVLPAVLERLGRTVDDAMAVGDGYNDVTMLKTASIGVAMANAHDGVQDSADFVTLSNEQDGLAVAMEKFIFVD